MAWQPFTSFRAGEVVLRAHAALALDGKTHAGALSWAARDTQLSVQDPYAGPDCTCILGRCSDVP